MRIREWRRRQGRKFGRIETAEERGRREGTQTKINIGVNRKESRRRKGMRNGTKENQHKTAGRGREGEKRKRQYEREERGQEEKEGKEEEDVRGVQANNSEGSPAGEENLYSTPLKNRGRVSGESKCLPEAAGECL